MKSIIDAEDFRSYNYETEDERNQHCRQMAANGWCITSIKGGIEVPLYASFERI